jgi:hypothetical protein
MISLFRPALDNIVADYSDSSGLDELPKNGSGGITPPPSSQRAIRLAWNRVEDKISRVWRSIQKPEGGPGSQFRNFHAGGSFRLRHTVPPLRQEQLRGHERRQSLRSLPDRKSWRCRIKGVKQ